jgi:hypothetical protein
MYNFKDLLMKNKYDMINRYTTVKALFYYMGLALLLASCKKDLLDRPIVEIQQEDVFTNVTYTAQFLNNIYGSLPNNLSPVDGTLYEVATDDARFGDANNGAARLAGGALSPFFNPDDRFSEYYQGIRKCNLFLENIDRLAEVDHGSDVIFSTEKVAVLKPRWSAEAIFLRAFFYFELAKRYNGVPLVLNTLSVNGEINLPRNTFDEVIAQIVKDCDQVSSLLPSTYAGINGSTNIQYGHATKWAAQALKARALLYAASPLFNPTNSLVKWNVAAEAAKPFFDGTAPFNLTSQYAANFSGNTFSSTEIIWSRVFGNSNTNEVRNYPVGFSGATGNGVNPSQNFVDAFEMKTGIYNPANPYANRDPRLFETVIYNGATFNGRTIETFIGGADGPDKNGGSLTGYYLKKLSLPTLNLQTGQTGQHNAIYFRSAEMLLNYAEALNESEGPTNNVYAAVNRVRQRISVGMPVLPVNLTKGEMRERIRNERRVELSFEGHRYWDVRRWNLGSTFFNTPLKGMQIQKNGSTFTYTPYVIEQRRFEEKMSLYPIQLVELQANPKLTQTKGW